MFPILEKYYLLLKVTEKNSSQYIVLAKEVCKILANNTRRESFLQN